MTADEIEAAIESAENPWVAKVEAGLVMFRPSQYETA